MLTTTTIAADPPAAQVQKQMPRVPSSLDILKSCPPGYRIEFMFGSTSLYIDPRWLGNNSLLNLSKRFDGNCPTEAVSGLPLYFNRSVLRLAKVPVGLGHPTFFFKVDRAKNVAANRTPGPSAAGILPAPPKRPHVEDVTRQAVRASLPVLPYARVYELRYPIENDQPPSIVRISCDGEHSGPTGRACFAVSPYRYRKDLDIKYRFRQDRLPVTVSSQSAASGMMSEADGVLEFDIRIRAWIDSLRQKP